jgi:hypothetical protein
MLPVIWIIATQLLCYKNSIGYGSGIKTIRRIRVAKMWRMLLLPYRVCCFGLKMAFIIQRHTEQVEDIWFHHYKRITSLGRHVEAIFTWQVL